jgi:hypothetical protein
MIRELAKQVAPMRGVECRIADPRGNLLNLAGADPRPYHVKLLAKRVSIPPAGPLGADGERVVGEIELVASPHPDCRMMTPSRLRVALMLADAVAEGDKNLLGLDPLLAKTLRVEASGRLAERRIR